MTAPATLDVSVVVPLYGGEKTIASLVERVSSTLAQEGWSYEIWLVCDQPRDRSWEIAARLASERSDTHAIRLMRNFGQHPATLLGIRRAQGATIVTTDFILGVDGANMEMSKRMMDVNMMASNQPGARERTFEEYAALFSKAGLAQPPQLVKMRDLVSTVVTEV